MQESNPRVLLYPYHPVHLKCFAIVRAIIEFDCVTGRFDAKILTRTFTLIKICVVL